MRINNRTEIKNYRDKFLKELERQKKKIYVCGGTGCVAGGSMEIFHKIQELIEARGLKCEVILEEDGCGETVGLKKSGCHGFCEMGPVLRIEPAKLFYLKVKLEDCEEIVEKSIIGDEVVERLIYNEEGKTYPVQEEIPFYKHQTRTVLEDCGQIDAESINEYIAYGGYSALEKCLFDITRDDIVKTIYDSNLRGRGGGGFPAGRKWQQVKNQKAEIKYVVCNGDEGDPGAFMDRSIMEGDPHKLLEGMIKRQQIFLRRIAGFIRRNFHQRDLHLQR